MPSQSKICGLLTGLMFGCAAIAAPATQPDAVAPSTAPSATITPDARALLEQVGKAYASAKNLTITGTIDGNMDIDGQTKHEHSEFTGSRTAGGKFRNEMKGDTLVGSTGQKVYVFLTLQNALSDVRCPPPKAWILNRSILDTADLLRDPGSFACSLSLRSLIWVKRTWHRCDRRR